MALTIEIVYENGILKPVQALPRIAEGSHFWVTLHIPAEQNRVEKAYGLIDWTGDAETVRRAALDQEFDALGPEVSRVRQTAGLIGWTGSQEEADFVALSPELDPQEHA